MQTIRFQELTPSVYSEESRDFQVLERLNDAIFNGIKSDVDSIRWLTNTRYIKADILPLLQTKLGFFSTSNLSSEELRYVLMVFPYLIKNKGSLLAVKQLLNVCLKINGVQGEFIISYTTKPTIINGVAIESNTVIVGLDTIFNSTEILRELASYILPAGFSFYIYYYKNIAELDKIYFNDDVKILYSSINLMSQIRSSDEMYGGNNDDPDNVMILTDSLPASVMGAIDTMYIDSNDSEPDDDFLGIFDEESDLPSTGVVNGNIAITREEDLITGDIFKVYYYNSSDWHELNFLGSYEELSDVSSPQSYDVAAILNNQVYKIYNNNSWVTTTYRGVYTSTSEVLTPANNDLICLTSGSTDFKFYNGTWQDAKLIAVYSSTYQIPQSSDTYDVIKINGADFKVRINNSWVDLPDVYTLKQCLLENE